MMTRFSALVRRLMLCQPAIRISNRGVPTNAKASSEVAKTTENGTRTGVRVPGRIHTPAAINSRSAVATAANISSSSAMLA